MAKPKEKNRQIPALKVRQWLKGWDQVDFNPKHHRRQPEPNFYLFSLSASELRSLCGIQRRQTSGMTSRAADLGIQRQHDPDRSAEIARFFEFGYPWSTLGEKKRESHEFDDLRKPGWLPTAIVINILQPKDKRQGSTVAKDDVVKIVENGENHLVSLPYPKWSKKWRPSSVPPFEVIDGQHRLWAFGDGSDTSFELPVVAFYGLDISWQAYLFWTINIKPKKINPSLAFDLYPLLRAEDWLDRAEGHLVYKETRSQELTEALWSHSESPWYDRINMLGERGQSWVTQSAWIKSLMATFIRSWRGSGKRFGGLYGSRLKEDDEVLGWSRAQQAAFLIFAWQVLKSEIHKSKVKWAEERRSAAKAASDLLKDKSDPAFYGPFSLIVTDQGVRGYLYILNDLCFLMAPKLDLRSWQVQASAAASDDNAVTLALKSLRKHPVSKFVKKISIGLASFDWRTSGAPEITENQRRDKLVFRGSSGYKELRIQLLEHLVKRGGDISDAAKRVLEKVA